MALIHQSALAERQASHEPRATVSPNGNYGATSSRLGHGRRLCSSGGGGGGDRAPFGNSRAAVQSGAHAANLPTAAMATHPATDSVIVARNDEHFVQIGSPLRGRGPGLEPRAEAPKLTLEWTRLTLTVSWKNPETKAAEEKEILSGVSGRARPGELLVVMGPSGAGKSSLLDCIAGRNARAQGCVVVNGSPWTKRLKRFASYVQQEDMFYATISVREHLLFQAQLRMGRACPADECAARVDAVLEELGLAKCRDTPIGGLRLRGISGGERKRLSFATEVLTNPSVLFVDEPTSGLDSFMAEAVMLQLQRLARGGRTVVATVHQPSSELFALFDRLLLLCEGSVVYDGRASDAVAYFARLGYQCPEFVNPTDFFMRQLIVLDKEKDEAGVKRLQLLKDEWTKHERRGGDDVVSPRAEESETAERLAGDGYEDGRLGEWGQLRVLASRNVLRLVRDRIAFRAGLFMQLFISVIVGLIYLRLDVDQKGIQNFSGAFFVIIVNQTFTTASPLFIAIPNELPMVLHEYKSGLYRLHNWYLSKILSELPLQIVMPFAFFLPTYFLVGFGHGVATYFSLQVFVVLLNFAAVGLGYMVSGLCRRVEIAPMVGIILLLPFMLFGGLFLNADDTPPYFIWIQYISPIKYGYEGMMKVFWHRVDSVPCDLGTTNCIARSGQEVLDYYSMVDTSAWFDVAMLLILGLVFRVVGFAALVLNVRGASK